MRRLVAAGITALLLAPSTAIAVDQGHGVDDGFKKKDGSRQNITSTIVPTPVHRGRVFRTSGLPVIQEKLRGKSYFHGLDLNYGSKIDGCDISDEGMIYGNGYLELERHFGHLAIFGGLELVANNDVNPVSKTRHLQVSPELAFGAEYHTGYTYVKALGLADNHQQYGEFEFGCRLKKTDLSATIAVDNRGFNHIEAEASTKIGKFWKAAVRLYHNLGNCEKYTSVMGTLNFKL